MSVCNVSGTKGVGTDPRVPPVIEGGLYLIGPKALDRVSLGMPVAFSLTRVPSDEKCAKGVH